MKYKIPFPCLLSLATLMLLVGCDESSQGVVMMLDSNYVPHVELTSADGISSPDGLRLRGNQLWIADEGGSACRVFDLQSRTMSTLCDREAGIRSPEDLVLDGNGNFYFTDDEAGGVWRVDAKGNCSLLAGREQGLDATEAIAIAPDGRLLVGDAIHHQVLALSPDTAKTVVLIGPERDIHKPESFAWDESGNLLIADNREQVVYRYSSDGRLTELIHRQPDFSPESIHYANQTLYITDSRAGKLRRFTPTSGLETVAAFGGAYRSVQGVTTDSAGNIYVSIQTDLKDKIGFVLRLEKLPAEHPAVQGN